MKKKIISSGFIILVIAAFSLAVNHDLLSIGAKWKDLLRSISLTMLIAALSFNNTLIDHLKKNNSSIIVILLRLFFLWFLTDTCNRIYPLVQNKVIYFYVLLINAIIIFKFVFYYYEKKVDELLISYSNNIIWKVPSILVIGVLYLVIFGSIVKYLEQVFIYANIYLI